jgi:hypothetical protein
MVGAMWVTVIRSLAMHSTIALGSKPRCTTTMPARQCWASWMIFAPMWNSGIMISSRSAGELRWSEPRISAAATWPPCPSITPFGRPVVPDV